MEFNQKKIKFNQKLVNLNPKEIHSIQYDFFVGFRIGPKSTLEFGRLGIQIINDSIQKPLSPRLNFYRGICYMMLTRAGMTLLGGPKYRPRKNRGPIAYFRIAKWNAASNTIGLLIPRLPFPYLISNFLWPNAWFYSDICRP